MSITDEAPRDPAAPVRKTLPSGKVVEIRSHRTLLGAEIATAMASQPGSTWMANSVAMRNTLLTMLATEVEPGGAGTPMLAAAPAPDGTLEAAQAFEAAHKAVLAQRADDYRSLYSLVEEAMKLALGLSVIIDHDEYEDPKAPTADGSAPEPGSGDVDQPNA
jgi:hypothetical protein